MCISFLLSVTECPIWQRFDDRRGTDGQRDEDASTEAECKSSCIANANCVGFDHDTRPNPDQCWLHLSEDNIDSLVEDDGVNFYQLIQRCPDGEYLTSLNIIGSLKAIVSLKERYEQRRHGWQIFRRVLHVTVCSFKDESRQKKLPVLE